MDKLLDITKALSEEKRLRILMALKNKKLCSCQLSELLELTESTISTHMSILKRAGLVTSEKNGRWVYYSLPEDMPLVVKNALKMVFIHLEGSKMILKDRKKLQKVKKCEIN